MRYTTLIQMHLIAFGTPYIKINRHLRKYTTNQTNAHILELELNEK